MRDIKLENNLNLNDSEDEEDDDELAGASAPEQELEQEAISQVNRSSLSSGASSSMNEDSAKNK